MELAEDNIYLLFFNISLNSSSYIFTLISLEAIKPSISFDTIFFIGFLNIQYIPKKIDKTTAINIKNLDHIIFYK